MHNQIGQGNEQLVSCARNRWLCRPGSEAASTRAAPGRALFRNFAQPDHALRRVGLIAALLACVLSMVDGKAAIAADVKLATLDWPPYTSPTLPQNGMVSKILAQAAQQSGYSLGFGFFPWVRAMRMGRDDPNYVGYFPAYWTPERAQSCNFSEPIGIGQVGLVQRRDDRIDWQQLTDLSSLMIGVTAGYSNGSTFDTLVADGALHVQPAPADIDNLRMVARGRIRVAVIERSVFDYSLLTDPDLHRQREDLAFNSHLIAQLPLYVCFKKTLEGARWKKIFDAGLSKINLIEAQRDYLATLVAGE